MPNCFGPIGEILALFGALGFILSLFGGLFVAMDLIAGNLKEGEMPVAFPFMLIGLVFLILVIIGGLVNQAFVPAICSHM